MKNEAGEAVPPAINQVPVLLSEGIPISSSTSIEDALKLANLTLQVGQDSFRCVINPPRIKDLSITVQPMSGYFAYADAVVANADVIRYRWFIGQDKLDSTVSRRPLTEEMEVLCAAVERCCTKKGVVKPVNFTFLEETELPQLRINDSHVGKIVCCIANPIDSTSKTSLPFGATCKQPVQPGPGLCPYQERQKNEINEISRDNGEFRVCSYNILSDALAETEFSKEGLFPYCDDSYVAWSYREHLLLDEIIGYKPSLLALQELDAKRYKG